MPYESDAFHGLADEYGRLIWQEFAFANFDCPTDAPFVTSVQREAQQFLSRTRSFAWRSMLRQQSRSVRGHAWASTRTGTQTLFT